MVTGRITRRRALAGLGLAVLGAGAATAVRGGPPRAPGRDPAVALAAAEPAPAVVTTSHRIRSQARGQTVEMITMVPWAVPVEQLPVCLVLHGRGNDARGMVSLGLPTALARHVAAGRRPIALVAVDGGGANYWLLRRRGDDPQAMLRAELPGWLAPLGLHRITGALGISMGGFGALVYARDRAADPPAVAAISPGLYRSWAEARTTGCFASQEAWTAADPLARPPTRSRVGLWCGQQDRLFPGSVRYAATAHPSLVRFSPGGHEIEYWRRVMPEVLSFLGESGRPQGA